ncbi:hypothetical protein MRY87_02785 [bacterium]|nr:hypothetical protein [bacterium]
MPRRRRCIEKDQTYEICFRAKSTLPFVAYRVIDLIINHALARSQRDEKLYLCHDIWNGSHSHLMVRTKDGYQCVKFCMEVKKKITDCLKQLLGLEELSIWEERPMIALVKDLEKAKERIVYLYANPAQDNLVERIEDFPGLSSYREFQKVLEEESLEATTIQTVPRLRLSKFTRAKSRTLTPEQDSALVDGLWEQNEERQELIRHPNMWMKAYGITDGPRVAEINQEVMEQLRKREAEVAEQRQAQKRQVMGAKKLRKEPILKKHKPKKKERKIFYLGSCNKERMKYLAAYDWFCKRCRECYERWLKGDFTVEWPEGAFRPSLPPPECCT